MGGGTFFTRTQQSPTWKHGGRYNRVPRIRLRLPSVPVNHDKDPLIFLKLKF